jgi:3-(3-hydroxy-phenyl)propionate hydroxylase
MKPDSLRFDIGIVGAGPVGLTLANLLGVYGIRTVLIEKHASTVSEPRAVSIDDESLRVMQAAGLVDIIKTNLVSGYGSSYLSPTGKPFAFVDPDTVEFGYQRRNAFNQEALEAQLREGLERFDCITSRFNHELKGFSEKDDHVALSVIDNDGELHQFNCSYVCACDGASSFVRRELGIQLEGLSYEEKWLIIDLLDSKDPYRHTRVHCDPARPGLNLPGPKRTRRFEFMMLNTDDPDEFASEESVRRLLKSHGPDEHSEIRRRTIYAFQACIAPVWQAGRVTLHGDAAHLTPPFAGQGMNSGIRDSANYAWKLAAAVNGQLGPQLLSTYERERKPHAWQLIKMAIRMGRVFMPSNRLEAFVVRTLASLLKLVPWAYDYISQMKYKPKPRFEDGFFIADGRSRRKTLSGRMFCQPMVALPDGTRILLDDALGTGFALLVYGQNPGQLLKNIGDSFWGSLEVNKICATPEAMNFTTDGTPVDSLKIVRDADGVIGEWLAPHRSCAVLLRPDRYVAAILPEGKDFGRNKENLQMLLNSTWDKENSTKEND